MKSRQHHPEFREWVRSLSARARASKAVIAACAIAASTSISCQQNGTSASVRSFEPPRATHRPAEDVRWNATSDQRFALGAHTVASAGGQPGSTGTQGSTQAGAGIVWDTPAGWTELPTSAMRTANFRVAGDARAECYLTLLGGDAGGLGANVNRWRAQMGLGALGGAELEALEHAPFLGGQATFVDIAGTYAGMQGGAQNDFRLAGLLLVEPAGSAFLKLIGPADLVGRELDAFRGLARSFRAGSAATATDPHAGHANESGSPIRPANGATGANDTANSAAGFRWTLPAGWSRAPERSTRSASFFVDATNTLDCYVTTLAGDAGGMLANVNRWRGQLGLKPLDQAGFDALERAPILGTQGWMVDFDSADGATTLVGALVGLPERSVFVKLSGARAQVAAARDGFRAFARSLEAAE